MKLNRKFLLSAALAAALTLIIGAGWLTISLQLKQVRKDLNHYTGSMGEEIERQQSMLEKIALNQNTLFHNVNESLDALGLPQTEAIDVQTRDRGSSENRESTDAPGTDHSLFFDGIQYLDGYYQNMAVQKSLAEYLDQQSFLDEIDAMQLQLRKIDDYTYALSKNDTRIFVLNAEAGESDPNITITSLLREEERFVLDASHGTVESSLRFIQTELDAVNQHLRDFREKADYCTELPEQSDFSELLSEKNLKLVAPENQHASSLKNIEWRIRYAGSNASDGGWIIAYGIDFDRNSFYIGDEHISSTPEFKKVLFQKISRIDERTPQQIEVARTIERMRKISEDPAFQAFLAQNDLKMAAEPREDGDYYYFDLRDEQDEHYGAFAVLKKHGKIYLTDREDIVISELKTIGRKVHSSRRSAENLFGTNSSADYSIDSLPDAASISKAGSSRETLMLLVGTHEKNAETMIIARLSEEGGIRLLSIPRDIYYKQRKISTYYRLYGIERLQTVLEGLTGVEFDGYITVDMYAFVDVVNILEGIEVYLEKPLIDPSYKIREQGEWKTLFYEAGRHYLNGIEALRIARSRHTTDDFDRSYRQQLLIKSLFTKMNRLHAGKLQEVYKLFKVLYDYVDTDFSSYDLAQFFLKYRSAEIEPKQSLSTDNILYNTYSNYYLSGLSADEVDEDFYRGAWILLPKEDDWDLIPRYVYQQLYLD